MPLAALGGIYVLSSARSSDFVESEGISYSPSNCLQIFGRRVGLPTALSTVTYLNGVRF